MQNSGVASLFTGLLLIGVIVVLTDAVDYCSICRDHTMCIYPKLGTNCGTRKYSGVDAASKQTIVQLHNQLRSNVAQGRERQGRPGPQPPASNMRALVWDDELAMIAQRWANQCSVNKHHDSCRHVARFKVGQNVYMSWSAGGPPDTEPDWEGAILSWYNEVAKYSKQNVRKLKFSQETGHYTQLVWADSSRIGCGYIAHTSGGALVKDYVCNYGQAGNWMGDPVYEIGQACSLCPQGTSCNRQGLCA